MTTANIYLNFDGKCEEAFLFYQSVLGGEFPYIGRFSDMPVQDGCDPGGQVTMPMENTFWGDYFGMFTDKFGVNWMVSFPTGKQ